MIGENNAASFFSSTIADGLPLCRKFNLNFFSKNRAWLQHKKHNDSKANREPIHMDGVFAV